MSNEGRYSGFCFCAVIDSFYLKKEERESGRIQFYPVHTIHLTTSLCPPAPHTPHSFPYSSPLFHSRIVLPLACHSSFFSSLVLWVLFNYECFPCAVFIFSLSELSLLFTCSFASHRNDMVLLCRIVDPSLLSAGALNLPPNATITEGRSYSLIWCFLFHSTSILTGSAETMQVGPTWPVSVSSPSKSALFSSVVQGSVLSTSLHCNFLDLLVFSSGDVAELCSEVTQVMQRAERKAAVTPFIKTVHHSLPSIESK